MGWASVAIMFIAYGVYIWQTIRTKDIRPHPFSWFLWGLVTGVIYLVQLTQGAGAGSWVTGLTSIICLMIGIISFFRHQWHFSFFDWISLGTGIVVFLYYLVSKNPIQSAILATVTDVIGYGSTIKKGWAEPYRDSVTSFALNSAKFVPSILALQYYSIATWLYPATLVVMNCVVAMILITRRYRVEKL